MDVNNGIAFEKLVSRKLQVLGWSCSLTKSTGDGGVDLVARVGNETLVVQCKDWSSPVGTSSLMEIHFGRSIYNATIAAVVSRSGFTFGARKHAKQLEGGHSRIYLLAESDLNQGSFLDRRVEQQLIWDRISKERQREREKELQENRRLERLITTKEWNKYDESFNSYRKKTRFYSYKWLILGFWLITPFCILSAVYPNMNANTLGTVLVISGIFGWFHGFFLWSPGSAPIPPLKPKPLFSPIPGTMKYESDREGGRKQTHRVPVKCPDCDAALLLPRNRMGNVKCPECAFRFYAETYKDDKQSLT